MAAIRVAPTKAARAVNLLRAVQFNHSPNCPCHSNPGHHHHQSISAAKRAYATPVDHSMQKEYAFEMAASSIRFGPGVTKEVGMDFQNLGAKKVIVVTDKTVQKLDAMKNAIQGLEKAGIKYEIFSNIRVEPKDYS